MVFAAKTWYLGWLGDMRALPVPETGFDMTEERYGGVHQALNGARTMDVTGYRQKFNMDFKYLSEDEYLWLRSLYLGNVTEPLYLMNPLRKNLLSAQASTGTWHTTLDNGLQNVNAAVTYDFFSDYPTGLPISGTRSPRLISVATGPSFVVIDGGTRFVPVTVGEPVTYSMYMRTTSGTANIDMYVQTLDKYAVTNLGTGVISTKTVTTAWQRFTVTHTPSVAGIAAARFGLQLVTASTYNILLAAPQVEYGNTATAFSIGGGLSKVLIDSIDSESPRYPLSNVSVSFLEA
jgi:hypothetical protein